ncbi:hypothetical protein CGRA01v4_08703 [Colletotrichum graminicola]|nr:hypothetical protein CGRA01v4_08703 [Colletotrichum graminicola]
MLQAMRVSTLSPVTKKTVFQPLSFLQSFLTSGIRTPSGLHCCSSGTPNAPSAKSLNKIDMG